MSFWLAACPFVSVCLSVCLPVCRSEYPPSVCPDEVVFDNSFSWARGKRVQYMVEVIGPVDEGMRSEIQGLLKERSSLSFDLPAHADSEPSTHSTKL